MTRQFTSELIQYRIRGNSIALNWFPSYRILHFISKDSNTRESLGLENPMRNFGELFRLKWIIFFLASRASTYVNGIIIPIDGGLKSK